MSMRGLAARLGLPLASRPRARGQATTEIVLLLPLFLFFLFAFSKIFAMLVLIQKMEIASYYAARRWMLESHRNVNYEGNDGGLCLDIQNKVACYLGFARPACPENAATQGFLSLQDMRICPVQRTQVWQVLTLTVQVKPINLRFIQAGAMEWKVVKYVPSRDRPIAYKLPGLQN